MFVRPERPTSRNNRKKNNKQIILLNFSLLSPPQYLFFLVSPRDRGPPCRQASFRGERTSVLLVGVVCDGERGDERGGERGGERVRGVRGFLLVLVLLTLVLPIGPGAYAPLELLSEEVIVSTTIQ